MPSDSWKNGMIQLIDIFINCIQRQKELDNAYTKYRNFHTPEMDHYLKYSDSSAVVRKKYINDKPYWSEDYDIEWLNMSKSEKNYTKCKGSRQMKSALRQNYINDRNILTKLYTKQRGIIIIRVMRT